MEITDRLVRARALTSATAAGRKGMKRIALLVGLLVAGGASAALADQPGPAPQAPPSGPVEAAPFDPYQQPPGPGMQGQRGQMGQRGEMQGQKRQLKAQLVQRFDRDGDGRLTGPERRAAKRFAMRLRHQRRLMQLRRFDANHDGWLSPDEQRAARQAIRGRGRDRAPGQRSHRRGN